MIAAPATSAFALKDDDISLHLLASFYIAKGNSGTIWAKPSKLVVVSRAIIGEKVGIYNRFQGLLLLRLFKLKYCFLVSTPKPVFGCGQLSGYMELLPQPPSKGTFYKKFPQLRLNAIF